MIPSTVVGLAIFTATLGPGYIFVRVEERRRPRIARTPLLEIAELLFIGTFSSGLATVVPLVALERLHRLDVAQLKTHPTKYLLAHPLSTLTIALGTLGLACTVAWALARLLFRAEPAAILGVSGWHRVLADTPTEMPM